MTDCAVLDVSACLGDLEPAHVANRLFGTCQRIFDGFLKSVGRGPTSSIFL